MNLTIGTRLGLGFASVLLMMLIAIATAVSGLQSVDDSFVDATERHRRSTLANEWLANTRLNVTRALAIAQSQNDPAVEAYFAPLIKQTTDEISLLQGELEKSVTSPEGKALLQSVAEHRKRYVDLRSAFFADLKNGVAGPDDLSGKLIPAAEQYIARIGEFSAFQHRLDQQFSGEVSASVDSASYLLVALAVVALLVGAGMAVLIARSVTRPVQGAVEVAQAIAAGQLGREVRVERRDELGSLQSALAEMRSALARVVHEIRLGSTSISQVTAEISGGNQDLSARTEQQAASLEETAASLEELTATVKQNADNARQASRLADDASGIAEQGRAVVGQVVSTMDGIADSSQRIASIIGVIDSIAFQTNILALNASVEAARAGEQGRGFAVVANEGRTLASRSAAAAQEIKALIEESVSRVQGGSRHAEDAGRIILDIVAAVRKVSDIIDEIAAASQEQSQGIEQINTAVSQLDQVTQQNASLVQRAAHSSQTLAHQAQQLEHSVAVFDLGTSGHGGLAPRPLAPAALPASNPAQVEPRRAPAASSPARHNAEADEWSEF